MALCVFYADNRGEFMRESVCVSGKIRYSQMRMDARRTMILCLAAKTFCIMQTHHSFNLNLDCSRSIFYLHYADQYQAKIHFPRERKNSIPFQLKLSANSQNTITSSVDWTIRRFKPSFSIVLKTQI